MAVRLAGRIVCRAFALAGSALLAGLLIALVATDRLPRAVDDPIRDLAYPVLVVSAIVLIVAGLPAITTIIIAEMFSIRSRLYFAISGAIAPLLGIIYLSWGRASADPVSYLKGMALFGPIGAAAGLLYWLLAGRSSGDWRKR